MLNLIPPSAKRSLKIEYWIRVLAVWLIIWSVALLVGASLMFPTYVLIGSQISATAEEAELAEGKVKTYESVSRELLEASQQAKLAVDETRKAKLSDYQALVKQYEGQGVVVNSITISRTETGVAPIAVSGVAVDRRAYAEFRDRLLNDEAVEEVGLPFSNIAQDKDIEFSLSVEIDNEVEL